MGIAKVPPAGPNSLLSWVCLYQTQPTIDRSAGVPPWKEAQEPRRGGAPGTGHAGTARSDPPLMPGSTSPGVTATPSVFRPNAARWMREAEVQSDIFSLFQGGSSETSCIQNQASGAGETKELRGSQSI